MLELHGRAMRHSVVIVSLVSDDQWDLPTPCARWTLRQLLAHMTTENNGFAAAASGETRDRSAWAPVGFGDDPRRDYAESADRVVRAFASSAAEVWLPNLSETRRFPATQAIGFHLLDTVVHSWDVAAALGRELALEDDLVIAAREVSTAVPDDERREGSGFHRAVPPTAAATPLDQLLAFLGRDPNWTSPAT